MNLSNATSQPVILPQPQTDEFPTLPPELMLVIIGLLSHKDLQTFCLLSQSSRQLALPALFRKLVYSQFVWHRIKRINKARRDVKAAIKELVLGYSGSGYGPGWDYESVLFPFLRSLPNLQSFRWHDYHCLSTCNQGFLQLVASLQYCPLEHFTYWVSQVQKEPVTAPPQLKSISVKVHHAYVYDLIRPSFSTLVELEIYPHSGKLDLLPLKPVGRTLRKFVYKVDAFDSDILDTIPDLFPHVTTLQLIVRNTTQDSQWKNSYDDAIAKNTKLQYLAVSAQDFIFCNGDPRHPHHGCKKCEDQRRRATRTLAMACTGLKRCRWDHRYAQYCFKIILSRISSEGKRVKKVPVTDGDMTWPFSR